MYLPCLVGSAELALEPETIDLNNLAGSLEDARALSPMLLNAVEAPRKEQ